MESETEAPDLTGAAVYSTDGAKLGIVDEVYVDRNTGEPEWVGLLGAGLLRLKPTLVPLQDASVTPEGLVVPYSKEVIRSAPNVAADEIDEDAEIALYSHYGLDESGGSYGAEGSTQSFEEPLASEIPAPAGGTEEASVIRSEEELKIGKRPVETGRVRLVKWVEIEPVTEAVELRQETATIEREPLDRPASGGDIGDEEIEVPLLAEEVVMSKETIAKEKISVRKDVTARTEVVAEEVRKEQVAIEEDAPDTLDGATDSPEAER